MGCVSRRLKRVAPQHDALATVSQSDKAHWCFDTTDHKDLDKEMKAKPDNTQAAKDLQDHFTKKSNDISLALAEARVGKQTRARKTHVVEQVPEINPNLNRDEQRLFSVPELLPFYWYKKPMLYMEFQ